MNGHVYPQDQEIRTETLCLDKAPKVTGEVGKSSWLSLRPEFWAVFPSLPHTGCGRQRNFPGEKRHLKSTLRFSVVCTSCAGTGHWLTGVSEDREAHSSPSDPGDPGGREREVTQRTPSRP